MGKKMEDAEPKKECPSCGLGVALEATVCEFCGWDFEEEDEWILQIEKLERELMLEKQKFEPGTVNHMIESTLRNPILDKVDEPFVPHPPELDPAPPPPKDDYEEEEARPAPPKARTLAPVREVRHAPLPAQEPRTRALKAPPPAPTTKPAEPSPTRTRTVRALKPEQKPAPEPSPPAKHSAQPIAESPPAQRRTRSVRKVKGA
ncbi:MAG: hypothetical protein MUE55_03815 [Thermoplasmata archaeon]|nr:hypothetical protein [Thermoplasmata archaeon]